MYRDLHYISLIVVTMNSRDRYEIRIGLAKFHILSSNLVEVFA